MANNHGTPRTLFEKIWDDHIVHMGEDGTALIYICLLYTSPSPRDRTRSRMPSSA